MRAIRGLARLAGAVAVAAAVVSAPAAAWSGQPAQPVGTFAPHPGGTVRAAGQGFVPQPDPRVYGNVQNFGPSYPFGYNYRGPSYPFGNRYYRPTAAAPRWVPGHWGRQWVPQVYTYVVWVPGYFSADGWVEGYYGQQTADAGTGYYQDVWVDGFWDQ